MFNADGQIILNTCGECLEPFDGYGAFCPDCLPAQDADAVASHERAAAFQQDNDAYWRRRWQPWRETHTTAQEER